MTLTALVNAAFAETNIGLPAEAGLDDIRTVTEKKNWLPSPASEKRLRRRNAT